MTNVATKATIESLVPYFAEGAADIVRALWRSLPLDVQQSDNLLLYTFDDLSTTKQEVDDTAGARPLMFIVKSGGTKCWIHVYNADADNVTEGVDVDFLVPVAGTSGVLTCLLCLGASWDRFWDTGLTVSASTATETSAAPTNTPDVFIVYAGS